MLLPSHHLTAEEAFDRLRTGQPLSSCRISGPLALAPGDAWDQEVVLEHCVVESFSGFSTSFSKPVKLHNCYFQECQFTFSYFLGGLSIKTCSFENYLDFQAGGHNLGGAPVCIANSRFTSFVNFFDCQYESAVSITDNQFLGGTNLLGRPHNIPVTFGVAPLLARNSGQLDLNDEGPAHAANG